MTIFSHQEITKQVADLCRWIGDRDQTEIKSGMSLTRDLGFDPAKMMHFFNDMEELYPGASLEDWFRNHSASGQDTIESVAFYLLRTLPSVTAE